MLVLSDTPHSEARDSNTPSTSTPAPEIQLEQPLSQALSGEMLDAELPWCSVDREFRGYAEADWWSTRNAGEYALSFG
jgi:hypothetical protein